MDKLTVDCTKYTKETHLLKSGSEEVASFDVIDGELSSLEINTKYWPEQRVQELLEFITKYLKFSESKMEEAAKTAK